jgi:hypothetical protein
MEGTPASTNDTWIDTQVDPSGVLATTEDMAEVQVRLYASRNEDGEKAEVACVNFACQTMV